MPKPGTIFTNKKLAETYARILKEAESAGGDRVAQIERARKAWSQGFVAEAIDKFCRTQEVMDVSGSPHRGVLSADDMARWQPTVEAPLTYDYGRYTVCKPGVWSQGPVMLQQLALLKGFDLDGLDPAGPDFIHLQVECAKLAYADREKFYGDPKFSEIPIATLLSDAYNDERRKLISKDKASLDFIPGSVEGFGAVVKLRRAEGHREAVGAMGAGEPTVGRFGEVRGDTVHFDIIDKAGNMVSATPSGGWLQSSPVIPEIGFCLGSRAQMFWLEENHPGSLAPGKRPRTTLSPTMALRDGEPYLAWGSPGGDQQDQWITQFFLRHVHAEDESAGSDRRAGLALRAFPDLVLAAHRAPRRARGRGPRAEGDDRRADAPRPHRRGRSRLVGRPPHRRLEGRPAPPRRRQPARHAGLRRRTLMRDDLVDHRPRSHSPARSASRSRPNSSPSARACRISRPASAASPRRRWSIPITASTASSCCAKARRPQDVIATLIAGDDGRESRQFTSWMPAAASPRIRDANASTGAATSKAQAFPSPATCSPARRCSTTPPRPTLANEKLPFARRLIAAMKAGEAAGGDKRGKQSAALLIHGEEEWSDLDLRVDDHADPLAELARLEQVSRERWVHFRQFLPTRKNPAGVTDRAVIDAAVQAAIASQS